jgi:hypothetical protein
VKTDSPNRKIKVGTQLTDSTLRRAKMLAARERKSLSDVIEDAIRIYVATRLDRSSDEPGLERFLSSPPHDLSWKETQEIMELDYFDQ